jgi:hypothetical protein
MTTFRSKGASMLCRGEGYIWAQDNSWPQNTDIVRAFSASDILKLHCIVNSTDRELFVVASSCRDAKIIAKFDSHLQGLGCGSCSQAELHKYARDGSDDFWKQVETAIQGHEPGTLWSAGYWSGERKRRSRERLEQMLGTIG